MKLRRYTKTTYNNVAYEFGNVMEYDGYYISMYNKIDDKCIKYEWGGYIRPVTPDEIGDIYRVSPYAIYKVALMGSRLFEKMAITPMMLY